MHERRAETGLIEVKTIGVEKATELRDLGVEIAKKMGVSGFLVVYNNLGMQECSQVVGDKATTLNVAVGLDKIKSVLATHRSTSVQRERMKANSYPREDFAGQLGSLFSGGVAIFADEELTQFVGAMAFSGGKPEQDEELCKKAIEKAGLYADLPKEVIVEPTPLQEFVDVLGRRIVNVLARNNIRTLDQLMGVSHEELALCTGIGEYTLRQIKSFKRTVSEHNNYPK